MSSETFVGRLLNHGKVTTKNRELQKRPSTRLLEYSSPSSADEGSQRLQAAVDIDPNVRFRHAAAHCGFGNALVLQLDGFDRLFGPDLLARPIRAGPFG
jgi:hypothetical protein